MGNRRSFFVIALLLFVIAGSLAAQGRVSGSIQGVVKDADGAALPGVTVTASSDALIAGQVVTVTDDRGVYRFPSLPVGTYQIEAALSGFSSVRRQNIRVSLGQILSIDLTLTLAAVSESITVTAEAPMLSVVGNSVASSFDDQYLETAPLPRNFYNIVKAAPGVNADYTSSSGSAMLAYGSTTSSQNAFNLDGVNVADAGAGQHWILPSIQWMEEIQVSGLGASAEYGGYTGGIINGVTKSGGNLFSGGLEYYYQPDSWVADNSPDTEDETFKFSDVAVSLGGPVVRDKVWFFISGELWKQVTTPLGAEDTSDREIPRYLGKLTWQLNNSNRLAFMAEHDAVKNERRGISELTLAEASSKQDGPSTTFSADWESLINPENFASVRLTGYDGDDDYLPYHGTDLPGRIDEDSGTAWVNQDIRELNHRSIQNLAASWNIYKDGLFGENDSHSFKFGGLYETAESSDLWRRNGGFTYYDDSSLCDSLDAYFANPTCGPYYVERGWGEYDVRAQFDGFALYMQDSIRMNRLTVNVGLRYGGYDAGFQEGHGDSSVYNVDYFDPRLGLVWDIRGDSRSALKVHWGTYHDKMYTYLYDRERSGEGAIPDEDCYWDDSTNGYTDCDTPTVTLADMGDVDHAYVDETLISFEQQFGATVLVGIDLADRGFRNIMAMVNTNLDYTALVATGNPLTGGTLPIYNLQSAPQFELTTDNGAYRDFRSATMRVEKRLDSRWSGRASLVWTDLDGNILKNNGYAPELRDLNGTTNADGRMDISFSEWEGKLQGTVNLPFNFQASGQYTYLSGWYWSPYVRVSGLRFNSSTGRDIKLVERGNEQLPDRNLVDLRLAWNAKLPRAIGLTLSLEAFNALNSDTVLDTYYRWGTYNISRKTWTPRSDYGTPYQIEKPREIRAGVRLSF